MRRPITFLGLEYWILKLHNGCSTSIYLYSGQNTKPLVTQENEKLPFPGPSVPTIVKSRPRNTAYIPVKSFSMRRPITFLGQEYWILKLHNGCSTSIYLYSGQNTKPLVTQENEKLPFPGPSVPTIVKSRPRNTAYIK